MRLRLVLLILLLTVGSVTTVVLAQGDTVGDPYYPQSGNTGYDVQHYTLEFDVADDLLTLNAVTTIEALATNELPQFNLDFIGFDVTAATVDSTEASFSREGQELTIVPAAPIAANANFTVSVSYSGVGTIYPDPALQGIKLLAGGETSLDGGWRMWRDGYIHALSQPNGAMSWYPCNNHPSDKATFTFRITVDEPNIAMASGILQETIEVDDDTNTFVWEMSDPMATQISGVYVGEFELEESVSPKGVPIRNYFAPNTPQETRGIFDIQGEMIDFLTELIGEYPFDAYGAVVVPGWIPRSGLEVQTLSAFSDEMLDEAEQNRLIMHELIHQWFGNSVSVRSWDSMWLHEGFAVYFEALWDEHTGGVEGYNARINTAAQMHIQNSMSLPAMLGLPALADPEGDNVYPVWQTADPGVEFMYMSVYEGGALALHALRSEVGDKTFFEILRTYYQRYRDSNAVTSDFTALAEEVAGRDLSSVWDTWLFGNSLPVPLPTLQAAS